jgi:ankyrin repeat protein
MAAVMSDCEKVVEFLLRKGADPSIQMREDPVGWTALHFAAQGGYVNVGRRILADTTPGRCVSNMKNGDSATALHVSLESEEVEFAKMLLGRD